MRSDYLEKLDFKIINFLQLEAKTYQFMIVEDANSNKIYDGAYFPFLQRPELIKYFPINGLKPNWDIEIDISFLSN